MIQSRQDKAHMADANEPTIYQIRIGGQLGERWQTWFAHMTLTSTGNGDTLITGPVVDQAALHGLLRRVRDLGLPLLSVCQIEPGQDEGGSA